MKAKTRRGNVWEEAPSVVETSFSFSFSFIAVVVVVAAVVVTVGSEPSLQLQKVKEKDCYVLLCKPYMLSLQQHVLISEIRRPADPRPVKFLQLLALDWQKPWKGSAKS